MEQNTESMSQFPLLLLLDRIPVHHRKSLRKIMVKIPKQFVSTFQPTYKCRREALLK